MPFVDRISSPMSESWTAWVLLILLLLVGWAIQRQPTLLRVAWQTTMAKSERSYSDAALDALALVMVILFRIGTVAMALDVLFFDGENFLFFDYLWTLLILLGMELVKVLIAWVVNFTYRLSLSFGMNYIHYSNLWLLTCVPMWCFCCICIYSGNPVLTEVLMGIAAAILALSLVVKGIRSYMTKLSSLPYVLLYVMTVEIVPMVIAAMMVRYVVVG